MVEPDNKQTVFLNLNKSRKSRKLINGASIRICKQKKRNIFVNVFVTTEPNFDLLKSIFSDNVIKFFEKT